MKAHEARAVLERVAYKPGWTFDFDGSVLTTRYWTTDVRNGGSIPLMKRCSVELEHTDESRFLRLVLAEVRYMELHEMCEWFKVDGETLTDPHPEQPE